MSFSSGDPKGRVFYAVPTMISSRQIASLFAVGFVFAMTSACEAHSKREMNAPVRELTYADSCGLQDYFDQRATASLPPPKASDEMLATNTKGQTIGEGSYELTDPLARRRFARLLTDEFTGVS